jgi:hypothetical protein
MKIVITFINHLFNWGTFGSNEMLFLIKASNFDGNLLYLGLSSSFTPLLLAQLTFNIMSIRSVSFARANNIIKIIGVTN